MKPSLKQIFNNLFKDSTEEHFIDGTYISKYSEKILNGVAKAVYYTFLYIAFLMILAGIYCLFKGIYDAIQLSAYDGSSKFVAQSISFGFLALIVLLTWAVLTYGTGVLISSALRVLTNISLSLKMLNNRGGVQVQQPMLNQTHNYAAQNIKQTTKTYCPECGSMVPIGTKACPECGCPLA